MKLLYSCPTCAKQMEETSSTALGPAQKLVSYKCGHSFVKDVKTYSVAGFHSINGQKKAYGYQEDGVKFIQDSGYNCLIADQMGLGKTIQALLALRNEYDEMTPCLVLVRSATLWQWLKEYKEWCDPLPLGIFMIQGTKSFIPPGFRTYLMSMDTLARQGMTDKLMAFGFRLVIVDECHSFKNPVSKRSQALVQFLSGISKRELQRVLKLNCIVCRHDWREEVTINLNLMDSTSKTTMRHQTQCPQCKADVVQIVQKDVKNETERRCGLILLSGTPIKNRAEEYFVPLNLLKPTVFSSIGHFRNKFLMQSYDTGKWNKVAPYMLDEFKSAISDVVIRRERAEVLPDLPKFRRIFTEIIIEDQKLKDLYNAELKKLQEKDDSSKELTYFDIQDNLMTLRRITGVAKCDFMSEYADLFLDETEEEKLAIGVHHHAVRDLLYYKLGTEKRFGVLKLSGEDGPERKNNIIEAFQRKENRLAIISTLAGGVGLNLQFCNNAVIIERQWSAADEEQFEDRFNRPGQTRPVTCEYLLAKGTIDSYFSQMVEDKRKIFGETVGNSWDLKGDKMAIRDLVDWTVGHRL